LGILKKSFELATYKNEKEIKRKNEAGKGSIYAHNLIT